MASEYEYRCSDCGKLKSRGQLVVKRVQFTTMGEGSKVLRSRVLKWLCVPCIEKDPDYNLEANRAPAERVKISSVPTVEEFDLRA